MQVDEELGSSQRLGTISSGGGGGTASAAGGGGGGATGPAGIPVAAAVAADADAAAERERVMARRAMLRNAMEMAAMQMISHPNVMQVRSLVRIGCVARTGGRRNGRHECMHDDKACSWFRSGICHMRLISNPWLVARVQVYSTFTNVTLGRCAKPDGSDYLFLKSAGEVEKGPGESSV